MSVKYFKPSSGLTRKLSPRLAGLMAAESKLDRALGPADRQGEHAYQQAYARYAKGAKAIIRFRARSAYDVLAKIAFLTYLNQPLEPRHHEDQLLLAIRDDVQQLAAAAEGGAA